MHIQDHCQQVKESDSILSIQQSAFVEGRRIGDNILLAQELMRIYHRDKGSPRCALKVYLLKAYDTINWEFLVATLQATGFPQRLSIGLGSVSQQLDSLLTSMENYVVSSVTVKV